MCTHLHMYKCALQLGDQDGESEDKAGDRTINWTTHCVKSSTTGPSPKSLPTFKLSISPIPRITQEKSPLQVFQNFITTLLLEGIAKQWLFPWACSGYLK